MKICFVGPANSSHIVKWCDWFCNRGHEVHVISFTPGKIASAQIHLISVGVGPLASDFQKMKYLLAGKRLKELIKELQPDIVNAHYATSYGTAVALSGVKPYILSVWGSDIFAFPKKSPFHMALLKYSLKKAAYLLSTSRAMASEAQKYIDREFEITPFGVDMELFHPRSRTRKPEEPFIFGTAKSLSDVYGIEYLIKAAGIIRNQYPNLPVSVRIAGDGPKAEEYRKLVKELNLESVVTFLGRISQEQVAREFANMDVAVFPSVFNESFGVAAVEAQACGTPVIISDADGLAEATIPGESSLVVPKRDAVALANAIVKLIQEPELRKQMGLTGRSYVLEKYELNRCFEHIETVFYDYVRGLHYGHSLEPSPHEFPLSGNASKVSLKGKRNRGKGSK